MAAIDPFYGIPLARAQAAQRAQARLIRQGAYTFACPFDTGKPHGPVQWLEPAPRECAVPLHIQDRMFTPVDVMRGQTGMEI